MNAYESKNQRSTFRLSDLLFKLNELKAKLSKQTIDYLAEQGINLTEIIQYELIEIKILDENA